MMDNDGEQSDQAAIMEGYYRSLLVTAGVAQELRDSLRTLAAVYRLYDERASEEARP